MSPAAALILEMQIYPIIRNTIPRKAKPMGSEDYQELVQDTTATAAAMLDAMEKSGKQPIPGSIAYYSIQRTKDYDNMRLMMFEQPPSFDEIIISLTQLENDINKLCLWSSSRGGMLNNAGTCSSKDFRHKVVSLSQNEQEIILLLLYFQHFYDSGWPERQKFSIS